MASIKTILFFLLLFFFERTISFAQQNVLTSDSLTSKLHYSKLYPSDFPGKNVVIYNWISDKYGITYLKKTKEEIIRLDALNRINYKKGETEINGELHYLIQFWCKKNCFQVHLSDFSFYDRINNEYITLDSNISSSKNINNNYSILLTQLEEVKDSLIISLDKYFSPYLSKSTDLTFEEFPEQKKEPVLKKKLSKNNRYNFELNFGYSKRTNLLSHSVGDSLKDYANGLRKGIGFSCNSYYYFKKNLGIGVNIFYTFSSNSTTYYTYEYNHKTERELSEKIEIIILAPSFNYRAFSYNDKTVFIFKAFAGYLSYNSILNKLNPIRGRTFCSGISAGVDHVIGKYFVIGYSLSYITGSMNKVKIWGTTIDLKEREGLNRIEAGVGIRFYL